MAEGSYLQCVPEQIPSIFSRPKNLICDYMFDGDPPDPGAQSRLDFNKTFAFKNFKLVLNRYEFQLLTNSIQ